jgi:hypothetical protein
VSDDPAVELENRVGHPGDLYDELLQRIQSERLTKFAQVELAWLQLMWSVDAYREAGVAPRRMGNAMVETPKRLAAIYRSKGNWFARVIATLLQQQTRQEIAAKNEVQGFSQPHQVDVAWPARDRDPLVCIETKVTGAPAFGNTPTRSALADYSNRRKEIKFAATDMKLYRRQQETIIEHWGVWRANAPPKTYFMWAARLRTGARPDNIETLRREAQVLIDTYLEGAGILAWRSNALGNAYEVVPLAPGTQVTALDDVLYRVATEIRRLAPGGTPPPPQTPPSEVRGASEVVSDEGENQVDLA